MDHFEAHDAHIPKLGFGTFELDGPTAEEMVRQALGAGYFHIDTAQMYNNEEAVGEGIRASGANRSDLWLTTKVWVDRFRDGDLQKSARESLSRLNTDYVDLLLLHWPNPDVPLEETIGALNEVRKEGLARHIGVSNFTVDLIREATEVSTAPLLTDQVEYHPTLSQAPVLAELDRHDMALTAYCPLGKGQDIREPEIVRIAERHRKSAPQVILRWHYQQPRVVAIPRTSSVEHLRSNLDVFDFELSDEEMDMLSGLARDDGRIINPSNLAPAWDNAA